MKKGERVRIWVMSGARTTARGSTWSVPQFDTVYKEGGYLLRRGADAFGSRDGP